MLWANHLTCSAVKTSKHLIIWIFAETSKHPFILGFWTVISFEQNILFALWWKHLFICSSWGFEQSYALTKHLTWSVVKTSKHMITLIFGETSKHLFIWRFWTVICFEQSNLLLCSKNIETSVNLDFLDFNMLQVKFVKQCLVKIKVI